MSKSRSWIVETGEKIATECDDDGGLIMEVLSKALIAVGFDHEAEIIEQMLAAYEVGETLPRFTLTWKAADEDARYIPADADPVFGVNDPSKLPEDDPRYIPF